MTRYRRSDPIAKRLETLEAMAAQEEHSNEIAFLIASAEAEAKRLLAAMKPINQEQRVEPRLQPRVPHYAGMPPPPPNSFPCEPRTTPNGRQLVIHVPGESMLPNPFTNHGRTDDEY